MAVIDIDVITDFVCAWCYLSHLTLQRAISLHTRTVSSKDVFRVNYHPYYLAYNPDPSRSVEKSELAQSLFSSSSFSSSLTPEKRAAITSRLEKLGQQQFGVRFRWGGKIGPGMRATQGAHWLVWVCQQQQGGGGREGKWDGNAAEEEKQQNTIKEAKRREMERKRKRRDDLVTGVFRAYHEEERDISEVGVLRDVARESAGWEIGGEDEYEVAAEKGLLFLSSSSSTGYDDDDDDDDDGAGEKKEDGGDEGKEKKKLEFGSLLLAGFAKEVEKYRAEGMFSGGVPVVMVRRGGGKETNYYKVDGAGDVGEFLEIFGNVKREEEEGGEEEEGK